MPNKLMGQPTHACQRAACAVQRCLADNQFSLRACVVEVNALRRCCA